MHTRQVPLLGNAAEVVTSAQTYEGIFYQEEQTFGDFSIQGLEDHEENAQTGGDLVVDVKDIDMLNKLLDEDDDDDESPPCDEVPPYYSRDSDVDSDDENPRLNYESDDSG